MQRSTILSVVEQDRFDNKGNKAISGVFQKEDLNGDSNRTMFTDEEGAAKYPFYVLQKPVNEVPPFSRLTQGDLN